MENGQQPKNSHRRTPSVIGPLAPATTMAKIAPAADVAPTKTDETATIMGLIGGATGTEDDQQLDIPMFKTEEGRYLATGKK